MNNIVVDHSLPLALWMKKSRTYPRYKNSGVEWLGEVPEHWDVRQLGRIGRFSKGSGGTKEDEVSDGVPCVRYGDLYTQHKFFIRRSKASVTRERASFYAPIQYGDILFAGSGETIDEIGKSAVNLISGLACCGGDVILFKPLVEVDAEFFGYATDCPQAAYQKSCMGRGITIMHIYASELKYMWVALPPLPEQTAIVRYLDYVDRRVRRFVRAKEKLIGLLGEQKQVIIHRAVTRGLDPDVPLKPSGVEWLGEVPEHWDVRRLRSIAQIINGATPASNTPTYWNGDIIWLTPEDLGKLTNIWIDNSARRITKNGYKSCGTTIAPTGSIAISTRAPIGHIGILNTPACVNQGCRLLVPIVSAQSNYLYYVLEVSRMYLESLGQGSTFTELSRTKLGSFALTLPPLPEQTAIVKYLDKTTADIDAAITRARREVELLNEYRARLIADVVTGKLDVREAAARLPDESDVPESLYDDSFTGDTDNLIDELDVDIGETGT